MISDELLIRAAAAIRERLSLTTSVMSAVPFDRVLAGVELPTIAGTLTVRARLFAGLPPSVWGMSTFALADERATIWLNREAWPELAEDVPRTRFTVAHELGHVALHAEELAELEVRPDPDHYARIEHEANRFAAHLLIPDGAIKRFAGRRIEEVARHFGVSAPMAARRIEEWKARQ